jgi:hypothetical protein
MNSKASWVEGPQIITQPSVARLEPRVSAIQWGNLGKMHLSSAITGAAGGIRTHDIQNHNLALLPAELQPPYNRQFTIPVNGLPSLHEANWVHIDHQCRCTPAFLPGIMAKSV